MVGRARTIPHSCAILVASGVLLTAGEAAAGDRETADRLFREGLAAMKGEHFDEGCPKLAQSYALDPLPGALFTLAECEVRWDRPAAALGHYQEYLDRFDAMTPDDRAKQRGRDKVALSQVAALKSRLAREEATPPPAPAPPPPTPPPPAAEPAPAPAPAPAAKEPPPKPTPTQPDTTEAQGAPVAGFVLLGVGGALLLSGGVASVVALANKSTVDNHCVDRACDPEGLQAVDRTRTWGWLGTGLLAAGAVSAAAGGFLVLTAPTARSSSTAFGVGPGQLIVRGAF